MLHEFVDQFDRLVTDGLERGSPVLESTLGGLLDGLGPVLVGTPIGGAILRDDDSEASWRGLVAYSAATLLGGATLYATAHVMHVRKLNEHGRLALT